MLPVERALLTCVADILATLRALRRRKAAQFPCLASPQGPLLTHLLTRIKLKLPLRLQIRLRLDLRLRLVLRLFLEIGLRLGI